MKEDSKVTRSQAARRLGGITIARVFQLEKEGVLPPHSKDERGRAFYLEADIVKASKVYKPDPRANRRGKQGFTTSEQKRRGQLAAKVFACFKRGVDNVGTVCVETEADPAFVEALWQKHVRSLPQIEADKAAKEEAKEARQCEKSREYREHRERIARINAEGRKSA